MGRSYSCLNLYNTVLIALAIDDSAVDCKLVVKLLIVVQTNKSANLKRKMPLRGYPEKRRAHFSQIAGGNLLQRGLPQPVL